MSYHWFVLVGFCAFFLASSPALSDDCNNNGVPDDQDIFTGTSEDCDSNGIPDECEAYVEHKLTASDAAAYDNFGCSVSISDDVVFVGAYHDDDNAPDSGSTYVFRFNGTGWIEEAKLTAPNAAADDWFGQSVSVSGNVAVVGASRDNDGGSDSGSAHVFRFNGNDWVDEAKLTASDAKARDNFGQSAFISGNVAIIGAYRNDDGGTDAGSAYIYRFNGDSWVEEAKLNASDAEPFQYFGQSVSLSGEVAVIGADGDDEVGNGSGAAYIFRFNGSSWVEEAKLTASNAETYDQFGHSVSISDDVIVIGSYHDNDIGYGSGSAYVFRFNGTRWVEEAMLIAPDAAEGDFFGHSVSINGDMVVVGLNERSNYGTRAGAAYVYHFNGISWVQAAKVIASNPAVNAHLGGSVSISGNRAVLGAVGDNNNGSYSGSAYVFNLPVPGLEQDCNSNGLPDLCDIAVGTSQDCNLNDLPDECDIYDGTSQDCNRNRVPDECETDCNTNGIPDDCERYIEYKLTTSEEAQGNSFGCSVSINGDVALIGAKGHDDTPNNTGSAYVYRLNGAHWIEEAKLTASDASALDYFGQSVSISGDVALIGAFGDDDNGSFSGSAYVFRLNGTSWVEEDKLIASDATTDDYFGEAVSISGNVAVIGASGNDDGGNMSGSAYVFRFNGRNWVEEAKLAAVDTETRQRFGRSVYINGDRIAVGATGSNSGTGATYIFRFNGTSWVEEDKLIASDAATDDYFGKAVSISGNVAVIGSHWHDDAYGRSGSAYVFRFNGINWAEEAKLTASDAASWDYFGAAVSISGNVVVIGTQGSDNGKRYDSGSAYVFYFNGTQWVEKTKLTASNAASFDNFGASVAADGNWVLIGTPGKDVGDYFAVGAAYMYVLNDHDYDGILDECDACPSSDLSAMIVINGCDTGVGNQALGDGCTMADMIAEAAETATNHGAFVSQVSHLTNDWKRDGLISGADKGRVQSCTAKR